MPRSPRALALLVVIPLFLSSCAGVDKSDTEVAGAAGGVPTFTVDPSWPLEMPNKWIMGSVTAVFVDAQDHVWVTHLPETLTEEEISAVQDPPWGTCCVPAPVVIEFDPDHSQAGGRVVIETKRQANWTEPKAIEALDTAMENRESQIGVFLMAESRAPARTWAIVGASTRRP